MATTSPIVVLCLGVWLRAALGPVLTPDGPPARSGTDPTFSRRWRFASLSLFLSQTRARVYASVPKIFKLLFLKFHGDIGGPPLSTEHHPRAHVRPSQSRRGFLVALAPLLLLSQISGARAVCPVCKDTVGGGTGCGADGATCPLIAGVASNAASIVSVDLTQSLDVTKLLDPDLCAVFNKQVCDTLIAILCSPAGGGTPDFTGKPASFIVRSALAGTCSWESAVTEINARIEAAEDTLTIQRLNAAISLWPRSADKVQNGAANVV